VYRGSAPDISRIEAYEAFLGMPAGTTVDYVLAFMADTPSWADFERGALQSRTNGPASAHSAAEWAPLLGTRKLVLATPACVQGTTWAQEAAGANDTHWANLAQNLAGGGLGGCVLRIAREFNENWYPWTVNPANAAAFTSGYAHIVTVVRAAGFTGKFMFNPYLGQGTLGPNSGVENVWPGDSVVDVIGLDFYDGGYPGGEVVRSVAQQQAAWNTMRDQWDGLTGWRKLAAAHRKPLAYPEWGLHLWNDAGVYIGGGDNANFIREMAAWFKDNPPFMQALWEDAGMGVSDPGALPQRLVAVPAARAAYLAAFGYGSS
jgi:hypothetical protein